MKHENIKKYLFISSLIIMLLLLNFNSIHFSKTRDMSEPVWIEQGCGLTVCGMNSCGHDEMCQSSISEKIPDYQIYLPPQIPLSPLKVEKVSTSKIVPDYLEPRSFFVDRKYRCHQTLDCIDTCNDEVDNDADAMEDSSDPSCSGTKGSDRTAPRACRTLFDGRISDPDFIAEGSGQCLDDFNQESCLALNIGNEKWTDIINLEYLHAGGALNNNGSTRNYAFTYTISVADTWEQKTITIPGDTTGTWLTTNGIGLSILIGLGVGTAFSGTAGSWSASFYASATGATSVVGTSGATFYITGVQLEANTTATPFENLQYGQQLALCQRYYYKEKSTFAGQYFAPNAYAISTTSAFTFNTFPVPMRTRPTALEQSGTASDYSLVRCGAGTSTICNSVPTFGGSSLTIGQSVFSVASGLSNGFAGSGMSQSTNAYLAWSAEL